MKATKEELGPRAATALHEAAHAVISYRTVGACGRPLAIVPSDDDLGHPHHYLSDSVNPVDVEARILSCYAGGCSQRRFDATSNSDRIDLDDEVAADLLRLLGFESREPEFRARAQALFDQYWPQIVAVAAELWRRSVLDAREVEIVCDQAAGDADADGLDAYRRSKFPPSRASQ
jgi:hypothetical protein